MKIVKDFSQLKLEVGDKNQPVKAKANDLKRTTNEGVSSLFAEMLNSNGKKDVVKSPRQETSTPIDENFSNEMLALKDEVMQLRKQLKEKEDALRIAKNEKVALQRKISQQGEIKPEIQVKTLAPNVNVRGLFKRPQVEEVFEGEVQEHLLELLQDCYKNLSPRGTKGSADRKLAVLEALFKANPNPGELKRRREELRNILVKAGSFVDDSAIAQFGKLGFTYVSGKSHHKFDYAGIRGTIAKTPSDYRAVQNAAAEFSNRFF